MKNIEIFLAVFLSAAMVGSVSLAEEGSETNLSTDLLMTLRHEHMVPSVAFSPDARMLASGFYQQEKGGVFQFSKEEEVSVVTLWDLATETPVRRLSHPGGRVWDVAFSPDGQILASSGISFGRQGKKDSPGGRKEGPTVLLWNPSNGERIGAIDGPTGRADSIAFSADGKTLVVGGRHQTVNAVARVGIWNVETFEHKWTFGYCAAMSYSGVAFSPDDAFVACTGERQLRLPGSAYVASRTTYLERGLLKIWNLRELSEDAEPHRTFDHFDAKRMGGPTSVAFSPDGNYVITGTTGIKKKKSPGSLVRLWDLNTGEEVRQFSGHTKDINGVAFAPNGKLIASCSDDQTVKVWDLGSGVILADLDEHTAEVTSVTFSTDGTRLASSSKDTTVNVWNVDALLD